MLYRAICVAFLLAVFPWIALPPAAGQDPATDAAAATRARTETLGMLRCHVIRPVNAAGEDVPGSGLLLGLPGTAVEADAFNRDLAKAFGQPGDIVATPDLSLDDPALRTAFRSADALSIADAEDQQATARTLAVRALAFLRQNHPTAMHHVRVVAALDGAAICMQLLADGRLVADEVSLVLPDAFSLPSLVPDEDDDDDADDDGEAVQEAAAPRAWPVFDVYLDRRSPDDMIDAAAEVRERLGPAGATARVYSAARGARSLNQYLLDAAALHRPVIIDAQRNAGLSVAQLVDALTAFDVVFYGELHDSTTTQAIEAAVFRGLLAKDAKTALSMEMFERDTQPVVDQYLAGTIDEAAFLAGSRPWPNYRESYRALIEAARSAKAPVIAANIPRSLARNFSRNGTDALGKLADAEKPFVARELHADPAGAYFREFVKVMGDMSGHGAGAPDVKLMYTAQCSKDDTMAESIADFRAANPGRRVLHINGRFHSDYGLGTAERLVLREPGVKIAIITTMPTDNPLLATAADAEAGVARFVVFVPASRPGSR
ncbi:MAG: ChaN family lipoprotein [Planctomycetota bacterium]